MTPIAPLADPEALVRAMGKSHRRLVDNLLERAADPRVEPSLREAHRADQKNGRTGEAYETYRDGFCDQVAASWVLCAVFARTLEDRGYVPHRIAGPGASDKLSQFRAQFKFLGERDYLLQIFDAIALLPGGKEVFGPGYAPLWRLGPTSRAVGELLVELNALEGGALRFSFGRPAGEEHDGASTRYLGDLYQDLNEGVRLRYALLQTPEFVERFLLENTLDPAIRERGIAVTVLDPACGSGHLLLGAYDRLFDARRQLEPGLPVQQSARKALGQVYGIDLNPYAAAVARFRLLLSYLDKAKIPRLDAIPEPLGIHVYVGDSLLAGLSELQATFGDVLAKRGEAPASPSFERGALLSFFDPESDALLGATRFDVVVANPPYIAEKDPAKRDLIRTRYKSAVGKYALSAPFVERIFQFGNEGGFTGQITSNSFMKREFGKALIEEVLPSLDLTEVLDTAGAYIPGHGTPTVILFGRARKPRSPQVRVVMGSRGEPAPPDNPAEGKVWSSIVAHRGEVGYADEHISVANLHREKLAQHPWSLGGGGAAELKDLLEVRAASRLSEHVRSIGFMAITGEDDAFFAPEVVLRHAGVNAPWLRHVGTGDIVRNWGVGEDLATVFPYPMGKLCPWDELPSPVQKWIWPRKRLLLNRPDFSGKKYLDVGRTAHEFHQIPLDRLRFPLSITFAFVATHNHFAFDRGGKVFNRSAPIIKLPEGATEEDHLALLGYLNSSTAGFWLKQVMNSKGAGGIGGGYHTETWSRRMEFDGTKLQQLPVPNSKRQELLERSRELVRLGEISAPDSRGILTGAAFSLHEFKQCLIAEAARCQHVRELQVALQEELDWHVYVLVGLAPVDVLCPEAPPTLSLGHRAFEVLWARQLSKNEVPPTDWYERHGGVPLTDLPTHWPKSYARIVEKRMQLLAASPQLQLIESADYKRRWGARDYPAEIRVSLEEWLCEQLEATFREGRILATRSIAQALDAEPKVRAVVEVLTGSTTYDLESLLGDLLLKESIASAKCQRYTDAGLDNHALWERTWDLQRLQDAGQKVEIPVPEKYDQKDFENAAVAWRLRGKLDVPKERFIAYPTATAPSGAVGKAGLFFGWAGWTHLQQLQATIQLWQEEIGLHEYELIRLGKRKDLELALGAAAAGDEALRLDTAARTRLLPLLQTMVDLLPWVRQWHNEDGDADAFEAYVTEQARRLEVSLDEARAYRRPARVAGRAGAGRKAAPPASSEQLTLDAPRARPAAALDDSTLAAAVEAVRSLDQGPGVALAELGERLGLSSAALKKTLDTLVEAGRLVERKKRPRLVSCKADDTEAREGAGS